MNTDFKRAEAFALRKIKEAEETINNYQKRSLKNSAFGVNSYSNDDAYQQALKMKEKYESDLQKIYAKMKEEEKPAELTPAQNRFKFMKEFGQADAITYAYEKNNLLDKTFQKGSFADEKLYEDAKAKKQELKDNYPGNIKKYMSTLDPTDGKTAYTIEKTYRPLLVDVLTYEKQAREDADKQQYIDIGRQKAEKESSGAMGAFKANPVIMDREFPRKELVQSWTTAFTKDTNSMYFMTDEERDVWAYQLGKYGEKAAKDYLEKLTPVLNRRASGYEQYKRESYQKTGAAGTVQNLVTRLALVAPAAVGGVYETAKATLGGSGYIDPNATGFEAERVKQEAQTNLTKNMSPVAKFLTDTGLSIADNVIARLLTGGGAGTAFILASSAAGSSMYQAAESGASPEQALAYGAAVGAMEYFTEKISVDKLDNLIKNAAGRKLNAKQFFKALGAQATSEGIEEVAANVGEYISGEIVLGDLSAYNQYKQSLVAQGYSKEEATRKAFWNFVGETFLAGLSGAISGGVMGGGSMAIGQTSALVKARGEADAKYKALQNATEENKAKAQEEYEAAEKKVVEEAGLGEGLYNYAKDIIDEEGELDALVAEGLNTKKGKDSENVRFYATQIKEQMDKGGRVDVLDVIALTEELINYDSKNALDQETHRVANDVTKHAEPGKVYEDYNELLRISRSLPVDENGNRPLDYDSKNLYEQVQTLANTDPLSAAGYVYGLKTAEIKALKRIEAATGAKLHLFYQSPGTGDFYDGYEKNGEIWINAYNNNVSSVVIAHELTHRIQDSRYYHTLKNIAKEAIGTKEWDRLIEDLPKQSDKYNNDNVEGEIVARWVQKKLLTDQKTIEVLVDKNLTLGERIWKFLKKAVRYVNGTQDEQTIMRAQRLFAKAIQETKAKQAKQKAEKEKANKEKAKNNQAKENEGEPKSDVEYSISKNTEIDERQQKMNEQTKRVSEALMKQASRDKAYVKGLLEELQKKPGMLPADIPGKTVFGNSSYGGKTVENSTLCPRSLAIMEFTDTVSEELGRPLNEEEQILLNQEIVAYSKDAECVYCFVAIDRKSFRAFAGRYIQQMNRALDVYKETGDFDKAYDYYLHDNGKNESKTAKTDKGGKKKERVQMWVNAYESGQELPTLKDVSSYANKYEGERGTKAQIVTDAYKYAQAASWAKKVNRFSAYVDEIARFSKRTVTKLNGQYGLRFYSFSDFSPAYFLETMQQIEDAAVMGLKGLAYTKSADFVKTFGDTNMLINMGTFAYVGNGQVVEDSMYGMPWKQAQELRKEFPNASVVMVATNDTVLEWALDQDWIDIVIPHHLVKTGEEIARKFAFKDYTASSSDKKTVAWKKGDKSTIYPTEHLNDKETYLRLLEENNLLPRFAEYLDNPNYMKLVNESRVPANEQKLLQPIFHTDNIKGSLEDFEKSGGYYAAIGGEESLELAKEIATKFDKKAPAYSVSKAEVPQDLKSWKKSVLMDRLAEMDAEKAKLLKNERADFVRALLLKRAGNGYLFDAEKAKYITKEYVQNESQRYQEWLDSNVAGITKGGKIYYEPTEAFSPAAIMSADEMAKKRYEEYVASLTAKENKIFKQAKNAFAKNVREDFNMPSAESRELIDTAVQMLVEEYVADGKISDSFVGKLFNKFYKASAVVLDEYYEENKHIKDYIRNTRIQMDDPYKSEFAEGWGKFVKSAFGTTYFVNENGEGVENVYAELHDMNASLFPESITDPASMARKIVQVAQGIEKIRVAYDEFYENDPAVKKEMQQNFAKAVARFRNKLADVKRYDESVKKHEEMRRVSKIAAETYDESNIMELADRLKAEKAKAAKVDDKLLLSPQDIIIRNDLLYGRRTEKSIDSLDEKEFNKYNIIKSFEAHAYEHALQMQLDAYKQGRRAKMDDTADSFLVDVPIKEKMPSRLALNLQTPERNARDIFADKETAQSFIGEYITPVHKAEADTNRYHAEINSKLKALNLGVKAKKGNKHSEAAVVQMYGEAKEAVKILQERAAKKFDAEDKYAGKTLSEWKEVISEIWELNPNMDKGKIENAVSVFRSVYEELYNKINEARVRNGYAPLGKIEGYFPHFGGDDVGGVLGHLGEIFGIKIKNESLPTEISGKTDTFKPGMQFFGHSLPRTGFRTEYNALLGMDKYLQGALGVIYQTDNIQKLRRLATRMRYQSGDEAIRAHIDAIMNSNELTEEQKEAALEGIKLDKTKFANVVAWLDEYTNLLANKKSVLDRGVESFLGRGKAYQLAQFLQSQLTRSMIGFNFSSWTTNFIPLTQASGELSTKNLMRGMAESARSKSLGDNFADKSTFLTNRFGPDNLFVAGLAKLGNASMKGMEIIDRFTSEAIVRARFYDNLQAGMDEAAAMDDADAFAASVMADRSKGALPTVFGTKNVLGKLLTTFQIEVNNQGQYLFKDLPNNMKRYGKAAVFYAFLKVFLGAYLFNELFEALFGRRPALDPFGMANDVVGDVAGVELPNLVDMFVGFAQGKTAEELFKTDKKDAFTAFKNAMNDIFEEVPFIGGLLGNERLALGSAMPDVSALGKQLENAIQGKDVSIDEAFKFANFVLPFGGQLSKTAKGVKAVVKGGRYSQDGERLQYAIDNENVFEVIQTVLLGPNATKAGRDWVENGFNSLSKTQTEAFEELVNNGAKIKASYYTMLDIAEGEDQLEKLEILADSNLTDYEQALVYKKLFATDSEKSAMNRLENNPDSVANYYKRSSKAKQKKLQQEAKQEARYISAVPDGYEDAAKYLYKNNVSLGIVSSFWNTLMEHTNGKKPTKKQVIEVLNMYGYKKETKAMLYASVNFKWEENPYGEYPSTEAYK